ncbi:YHS domain-containing (seleno)protein [Dapis sp. BLCC M172]|uniref:YHS domain-containing (seleno)protein n=1 Tax=Dapis sp. BLCC M172 TaxID=2975281 RepID=UPI003CF16A50
MKLNYFLTFAITSFLSAGIATGSIANPKFDTISNTTTSGAIAQNPCAGANPCAGKNSGNIYVENNAAIRGADTVSYFTQSKAVKGNSKYQYKWKGANWYFSSAENRDLFAQNPEKYAPQYGGHCAYGMAKGKLAPIDPNAWSIVDGKLYLNYSKEVKELWTKDIPGHIAIADQNWSRIASK